MCHQTQADRADNSSFATLTTQSQTCFNENSSERYIVVKKCQPSYLKVVLLNYSCIWMSSSTLKLLFDCKLNKKSVTEGKRSLRQKGSGWVQWLGKVFFFLLTLMWAPAEHRRPPCSAWDRAPPMQSQTPAVKTDHAQRQTARKTQDERGKKTNSCSIIRNKTSAHHMKGTARVHHVSLVAAPVSTAATKWDFKDNGWTAAISLIPGCGYAQKTLICPQPQRPVCNECHDITAT